MSAANVSVNNKFSVRLARKVHRLKKMLKPVIRFMHSRKASKPGVGVGVGVGVGCCDCSAKKPAWSDECEVSDNDANEALAARLEADLSTTAARQGGLLSVWVQGRLTLVPVTAGHPVPLPVSFVSTDAGDFLWAPLADSDVCLGTAGRRAETTGQTAEEQVPSGAALRCML